MNNHTDLINILIEPYKLKSYLEIGVRNASSNLNLIKAEYVYGVDPNVTHKKVYGGSSDDFFKYIMTGTNPIDNNYPKTWDIIFIDGLHHADQVKRDFENSLRCLNDNGFIIIHDTLPEQEQTTCVPRGNATVWHGNVYQFAMTLREYHNINFVTVNFDCGCTIVWKNPCIGRDTCVEPTWKNYLTHRDILLKIIHPKELLQHLP